MTPETRVNIEYAALLTLVICGVAWLAFTYG